MNPSVELVTSRNHKVIKVNALNETGEIIISNEDFIGMDVELACEKVVNLSVELGYLEVNEKDTSFETEEGSNMSIQVLIELVKEKKPFQYKIKTLENRKTEIIELLQNQIDETEVEALNQELNEINAQLEEINLIKEKVKQDKTIMKEKYQNIY